MNFPKVKKAHLGLYLGWQGLTIVELVAKKINNFVFIPYAASQEESTDITEILSDSVKFAALIQKGLRQLKIEASDVKCAVALTQRDILVRFFSMPSISASEVDKALSFEIRKYIPFRLEELQYVSQRFHRISERKLDVLWVGIKKDAYKEYLSILGQANVKIGVMEPVSMSVIRLLANKIDIRRDSIAIIDSSNIESNITIINKGIPIFSREVKFSSPITTREQDKEFVKLGNEFRMAFDFYRRQYALGEVSRIILIADIENSAVFEEISKEIGISLDFFHPKDLIESNVENIGVEAVRAAGVSLKGMVKTNFTINLHRLERKKSIFSYISKENAIPISKMAIVKAAIICASVISLVFVFDYVRIGKLKRELSALSSKQPQVSAKYINTPSDLLERERNRLQENSDILQGLIEKPAIIAGEQLSILAKVVPNGVWLDSFSYAKKDNKSAEVKLSGFAYLGSDKEESKAVDSFISALKADEKFTGAFKKVQLDSRARSRVMNFETEKFYITCSSQ